MTWYLCQTKVKSEFLAKQNLERQNFSVYLPEVSGAPLFPGYLFLQMNGESFQPINSTKGVMKLVSFGDGPAEVPADIVNALRSTSFEKIEQYPEDSPVRITNGPFIYREAIVKVRKGDRIWVVMQIMQQHRELEFSVQDVEAA